MNRVLVSLAALVPALPAVDALSELALASPRGEEHSGPGGSDLGWLAQVQAAPSHRIDGIAEIARDHDLPDGQVVMSLCWNHVTTSSGEFGGTTADWNRLTARVGTDPLADTAGRPLVGIQGLWSAENWGSGSLAAAWSADRGAVLAAEACLLFLRLRVDRDDLQSCYRIGTGPRFLGSDAPWSGALLVDYVAGQVHGEHQIDGGQVEAWVAYRLTKRLVIAIEAQAAARVRNADGSIGSCASGALVLSCSW